MDTRLVALLMAVTTACGNDIKGDGPTPKVDAAEPGEPTSLRVAPTAWLMVVDRSASWERRLDRRLGLRTGYANFVAAAPDVTFAATSFPKLEGANVSCAHTPYTAMDVAWGASASLLDAHFGVPPGDGGSALGPALAGANAIARDYAAAQPEAETSIVLLTDATPSDDETCEDSAWDQLASSAASIFAAGAGHHVHVISVLGPASAPDHFGRFDAIVSAGGGFAAFVNGSTDDIARSTKSALDIMAERATCTRLLDGARPDFLEVAFADGTRTVAHRVADASACEPEAFYVDHPDAPTKATLCSGPSGIGGFCELTYVRARTAGPPTITPVIR